MATYFVPSSSSKSTSSSTSIDSMQAEIEQLADAQSNRRSPNPSSKAPKYSKSHLKPAQPRSTPQPKHFSQQMHSKLERLEKELEEDSESEDTSDTIDHIKRGQSQHETFKQLVRDSLKSSAVKPKAARSTASKAAISTLKEVSSSSSSSTPSRGKYCNNACKYNMNVYEFEKLQKDKQALTKKVNELTTDLRRHADYNAANIQKLKVRNAEMNVKNKDLRERLKNNQHQRQDEAQYVTDLKQQIIVLQSAVINYDNLKQSNDKLQSEYNEMCENAKELRKNKAFVDKQLIGAQQQIENMEVDIRQLNYEKMTAMSEMRAMKSEFEQERKNISNRYDRIVQKYEAELAYAKKMYQQTNSQLKELQQKFENEQPQFEKLRTDLAIERDGFQKQLNDMVIDHVAKLDLIGKQSNDAIDNAKWANERSNQKRKEFEARERCFTGCSCPDESAKSKRAKSKRAKSKRAKSSEESDSS